MRQSEIRVWLLWPRLLLPTLTLFVETIRAFDEHRPFLKTRHRNSAPLWDFREQEVWRVSQQHWVLAWCVRTHVLPHFLGHCRLILDQSGPRAHRRQPARCRERDTGLKPTQSRETSPLCPSTPTYLHRHAEEAREEDYGEGVREEEHTREWKRESENKMFQGQKKRCRDCAQQRGRTIDRCQSDKITSSAELFNWDVCV